MANTEKFFDGPPLSLPACNAMNIAARAGEFVDDGLVKEMASALGRMDRGWRSTVDARKKLLANPLTTKMAALQELHKFAWGTADSCFKNADTVRQKAKAEVERMETAIMGPLKTSASRPLAGEVRAHVKSLNDMQRHEFVTEAIKAGDVFTAGSILGAPGYLSGLKPEVHRNLLDRWKAAQHPHEAARMAVIKQAAESIVRGAEVLMEEVGKLVDAEELKRAEDAARAAKEATKLVE